MSDQKAERVPAFLRRADKSTDPVPGQGQRSKSLEAAEAGIRAIHEMNEARDRLARDNAELLRQVERLSDENDSLNIELSREKSQRDYYMRFTAEQSALLTSLSTLLDDGLRKAREGAMRPNGAAPRQPKPLAPDDQARLENLARSLSPSLAPDQGAEGRQS